MTVYVTKTRRIIPYLPAKPQIYHTANQKFNGSNQSRADQCPQPKRPLLHHSINPDKNGKTKSAGKCHCPMRVPTPNDFKHTIQNSPDDKQYAVLLYDKFLMQNIHPQKRITSFSGGIQSESRKAAFYMPIKISIFIKLLFFRQGKIQHVCFFLQQRRIISNNYNQKCRSQTF